LLTVSSHRGCEVTRSFSARDQDTFDRLQKDTLLAWHDAEPVILLDHLDIRALT